jgi:predicted nucleic acid-binding protein
MPAIDVISDANVALKWFHDQGEEGVESARELLNRHRSREVVLHVLDLTYYEIGNALLRGHAHATARQTATVLGALRQICLTIRPDDDDLAVAAELADRHGLTLYDAVYAAMARRRGASLVTFDQQLLETGLGVRPDQLLSELPDAHS